MMYVQALQYSRIRRTDLTFLIAKILYFCVYVVLYSICIYIYIYLQNFIKKHKDKKL